jgi:hypothetical protein
MVDTMRFIAYSAGWVQEGWNGGRDKRIQVGAACVRGPVLRSSQPHNRKLIRACKDVSLRFVVDRFSGPFSRLAAQNGTAEAAHYEPDPACSQFIVKFAIVALVFPFVAATETLDA